MLRDEPEVLAWHLGVRGYPEWAINDQRTIFALLRLQIHERTHLASTIRASDPDTQEAWNETLRIDISDGFTARFGQCPSKLRADFRDAGGPTHRRNFHPRRRGSSRSPVGNAARARDSVTRSSSR